MYEIVPTILSSDVDDFSRKINSIKGICPRVQIDVVDGKFAETKTVDLAVIRDLGELGDFKVDLHLMVDGPMGWVSRALELVPDRIIAQVEKMTDPWNFVNEVIESGCQVGLALDLETPIEKISEDVYLLADLLLLLGVKAGLGGQELDPRVIEKIKKVREILGDPPTGSGKIGVDGGLNKENITLCKKAGADIFYIGHSFWQAPNQNGSGQAEDLQGRYNELLKLIS